MPSLLCGRLKDITHCSEKQYTNRKRMGVTKKRNTSCCQKSKQRAQSRSRLTSKKSRKASRLENLLGNGSGGPYSATPSSENIRSLPKPNAKLNVVQSGEEERLQTVKTPGCIKCSNEWKERSIGWGERRGNHLFRYLQLKAILQKTATQLTCKVSLFCCSRPGQRHLSGGRVKENSGWCWGQAVE